MLARNPAENFGRDWWVVDVAIDQGEGSDQRFYRLGVFIIGSKDIVLENTVPMAPVTARAVYANPAVLSGEAPSATSPKTAL